MRKHVVGGMCLMLAGCSSAGPIPTVEAERTQVPADAVAPMQSCEARTARLRSWADGAPGTGAYRLGEYWAIGPAIRPPRVASGWRPVRTRSAEIALRADGTFSFPDAGRGQASFDRRLDDPTAIAEVASSNESRIVVIAEPRVPASWVRKLRSEIPEPVELALGVEKPAAAIVRMNSAVLPGTPPDLDARLTELLTRAARGPGTEALREIWRIVEVAAGECDIAEATDAWSEGGGGMDILGPRLAERLLACDCRGADIPTMEAATALLTWPHEMYGWVPLWPASSPSWDQLTSDADVAALAKRAAELAR